MIIEDNLLIFLSQEEVKGKNKLEPRLIGVTKDAILRLDEKTKEILKTWPLAHIKRWASNQNVFTIDFGEYEDGLYSVQTPEGNKIAEMIAGYIDVICRNKRMANKRHTDNDKEPGQWRQSVIFDQDDGGLNEKEDKNRKDQLSEPQQLEVSFCNKIF